MSASKIDTTPSKKSSKFSSSDHILINLSARQVFFRKNGIEFHATEALPVWTEMTVDLVTDDGKHLTCNGVVVACAGNRHTGFVVALVFTCLNPETQSQLEEFAATEV